MNLVQKYKRRLSRPCMNGEISNITCHIITCTKTCVNEVRSEELLQVDGLTDWCLKPTLVAFQLVWLT